MAKERMLSEFEKKVADFVKANELFGSAEGILLAVSGGADSTALLYAMQVLKDEGILSAELLCTHINHQLRGYEADLDEQFVIAQAGELNLPITTKRVDVCEFARRNKLSIETAARKLRIASLLDIAKVNNCFFVATAHQKNDNAETILQRLLRGTGFRGLAGIWPVQAFAEGFTPLDNSSNMDTTQNTTISNGVKFVRPLLSVRRDEIIKYLHQRNLKWREDHTNADCTYTRNYIRHQLLPALQADYTGSIVEQLSQLAQHARKLNSIVLERIEKVWPELAQTSKNSTLLNLKRFLQEPKVVKAELIRRSITAIGSGEKDLTQRHYERILRLAEPPASSCRKTGAGAGSRKFELPGGFVVWREFGNLIFAQAEKTSPPNEQTIESVKFEVPGQTPHQLTARGRLSPKFEHQTKSTVQLVWGRYLIEATILDAEKAGLEEFKSGKSNLVEWFDADKVKLPLAVRHRRDGDIFCPLGLQTEKKVGKFLTAARVPQGIRSKTLIIADGEKIIWVWPIRITEQAKVTSQTHKILQLQLTETEPLS